MTRKLVDASDELLLNATTLVHFLKRSYADYHVFAIESSTEESVNLVFHMRNNNLKIKDDSIVLLSNEIFKETAES